MIIGYNVAAANAANYLNINNTNLTTSINELSSGSALANPGSNPAGVAVSDELLASSARLTAASQGAQDVVSFAQTTNGFLSTINQMLTQMSQLAEEATNGSFGSADRADYQTEFASLQTQIGTIVSDATFNGTSVFQSSGSVSVAINDQGDTDTFAYVDPTTSTLGISSLTISTTTAAGSAITALDTAINSLSTDIAQVGSGIAKFNFYVTNINTEQTNVQSAQSVIADVDVAAESTTEAQDSILLQASTAMLAQAQSAQQDILKLLQG